MAFQIQVLAPSLISYSLGMPWVSKEVAVLSISTHTHTNIHTKRHFSRSELTGYPFINAHFSKRFWTNSPVQCLYQQVTTEELKYSRTVFPLITRPKLCFLCIPGMICYLSECMAHQGRHLIFLCTSNTQQLFRK